MRENRTDFERVDFVGSNPSEIVRKEEEQKLELEAEKGKEKRESLAEKLCGEWELRHAIVEDVSGEISHFNDRL